MGTFIFKKLRLLVALVLLVGQLESRGQTCTLTASVNWNNASAPACLEGGVANDPGVQIINIPSGITLTFDSNVDTWTGTRTDIFGTLSITAPGQATINSNIVVKNGGLLSISSKLNIGSSGGCGYNLIVENGGTVDIIGSTPDRLNICGTEIARGGSAGCNPYPDGPLPYCEPSGGFSGPLALDENGDNPSLLPVELLYFRAKAESASILLSWKTASELNNDYFTLEKSRNGIQYASIGSVQGMGTTNEPQVYEFVDSRPYDGLTYYRLKQTDFDGTTEIFRPVSVDFEGSANNVVLYPNPISGATLFVSISNFPAVSDIDVEVKDVLGRIVLSSRVSTDDGGQFNKAFDFSEVPSGSYFVRLGSTQSSELFKIIKK